MMRFTTVLVSIFVLAACAADSPDGDSSGDGDGAGTGEGGGSGGGGGSGSGGSSMTASRFLEEINKKFCDEAFTCRSSFPMEKGTFDEAFGSSQTACYAQANEDFSGAQIDAQVAAGKITFNAAAATTCLAGIMYGTCEQFWQEGPQEPGECDTVLVGTVANGGACVTSFDCANATSYCDETTNQCTSK
jgi:hypothetical protein